MSKSKQTAYRGAWKKLEALYWLPVKECAAEIFYEPVMALTAPHEGLLLMEKMIEELRTHLASGGSTIFELSDVQNAPICAFGERFGFKAEGVRDMSGKARFVILTRE